MLTSDNLLKTQFKTEYPPPYIRKTWNCNRDVKKYNQKLGLVLFVFGENILQQVKISNKPFVTITYRINFFYVTTKPSLDKLGKQIFDLQKKFSVLETKKI